MNIAIFGAGSLGSLIGGLLAGPHDVTLVGRAEHMRAVATDGLKITGAINRRPPVAATTDWSGTADVDLCIVTVKAYDTAEAVAAIAENPPPLVLSLQNGFGPVSTLESGLPRGPTVLAGVTTFGAMLVEPGVVRCTGEGTVHVGDANGGPSAPATDVGHAFTSAHIRCTATDDMPERRWQKLAVNAGINPVTALARVKNGALLDNPLRPIAITAAREVGTIAHDHGVTMSTDPGEALIQVARQTRENESSMARDIRRNRRTEIDAITGAVLDRASTSDAPVNQILYGLIAGFEIGAGIRSSD